MSDKYLNRINWIDMARGYGIILVILGHMYIFRLSSWIYSFHMPLFFFLSGYVFNTHKFFSKLFVKKVKSLIKPYFFLSIIVIAYRVLESIILGKDINIIKQIWLFLIQRRQTALWFITCLFVIEMMYFFVNKIKHIYLKHCVVLLITLIGLTYEKLVGEALFWNIDIAFAAFGFFYIGVLFRNKKIIETINDRLSTMWKTIVVFVLFGINLGGAILNNKITGSGLEMISSQYGFWPLTYVVALSGIIAVVIISMLLTNKFLIYVGKNTWIYFGLHQAVFISALTIIYKKIGIFQHINSSAMESIGYALATMLIILVISTILNELIIRTKLKWFLNK